MSRSERLDVVLPGSRSPLEPERALRIGPGLPRDYVLQVQRERLIDAFVRLCATDGYGAAGVRATCKAAGVTYKTFYVHFKTKEELFVAAYEAGVLPLIQTIGDAYREGSNRTFSARVDAAMGALLNTLAENEEYARFLVCESVKAGPQAMDAIARSFELGFTNIGEPEPRAGLSMTISELIPFVMGGLIHPLQEAIRSGQIARLPKLRPVLTQFTLSMIEEGSQAAQAARAHARLQARGKAANP